jgi:cellulose biosynthesis protein BcsQ
MAANGAGTMITFYSYKGGTGRSMTLANVAWILASCGKKVLVIDWDLEAPGLHRYFQPFLVDADLVDTDGLIDYFWKLTRAIMTHAPDNSQSLAESLPQILDYRVKVDWPFESDGTLDFVPAGRQGTNYAQRVNSFDWNNFYGRLGGGNALDQMRNELKQAYDYVLIDSRTGVSDTSGICTVQMPDVLVGLFTLNNQSIEGVAAILASATGLRDPGREGDLEVFPVVSRVEDGEQDKLEAARGYARKVFLQFMGDRTQREVREYWDDMELPYRKFYAYEEVLATFGDLTGTLGSQTSLLSATERLTRRITNEQVALPRIEEERRQKVLAMTLSRGDRMSQ